MVAAFAQLLACQLAGEIATRSLNLPVPGPVLGLVFMAVILLVRAQWRDTSEELPVERTAAAILANLGLLFVPAVVGVLQQLGLLSSHAVGIALTVVLSTLLTLLSTVGTFLLVKKVLA